MPLAMGGIIGVNLKTQENTMNKGFTREQIERVARIYRCNQDASRALGITIRSFSRLCRKTMSSPPLPGAAAICTNFATALWLPVEMCVYCNGRSGAGTAVLH